MAISFKSAANNSVVSSGNTTISCTLPVATAAGDIILCAAAGGGSSGLPASLTISDGSSDTYTDSGLGLLTGSGALSNFHVRLGAFMTPTVGVTTVTATIPAGNQVVEVYAWVVTGFTGTATLDKKASNSGNSTAADSGSSGTLTAAVECAIGYVLVNSAVTAAGSGWSTGGTNINDGINSNTSDIGEHRVTAATTAIDATATVGPADEWLASLLTVYDAGAAAIVVGWLNDRDQPFPVFPRPSFSVAPAFVSNFKTAGISGIGFFEPPDRDKPATKMWLEAPPAAFVSTFKTAVISGMAFTEPLDQPSYSKPANMTIPEAFTMPNAVTVGIQNSMAWFEPWDQAIYSKPIKDAGPEAFVRIPTAVSTIAGMAWFEPWDELNYAKPARTISQAFVSTFVTAGISGIAWFEPRENDITSKGRFLTDPAPVNFNPPLTTWSFSVGDTIFVRDPLPDPGLGFGQPIAQSVVGISGMAWFESWDQPNYSRIARDLNPPAFVSTFQTAGISGIGWFEPPDMLNYAKPLRDHGPEAFSVPTSVTVGISGIAWFEPRDELNYARPWKYDAPVYSLPVPPSISTIAGMAWFEPLDIYYARPLRDHGPEAFSEPTIITVGISGIAWFEQLDAYYAKPLRDHGPEAFAVPKAVSVGISGMSWFEPPDRDRPALHISVEMPPAAFVSTFQTVGISGIGWFEPAPNTVKLSLGYSIAPALQQPIVQIAPTFVAEHNAYFLNISFGKLTGM